MSKIFEEAKEVIIKGDTESAIELARKGLNEGISGLDLINKGFIPGINEVGDKFGEGQLFLPELILSANAMQGVIDIINASLEEGEKQEQGKVIIGTVEGDLHDIGKTIVETLMAAHGFDIVDLGVNVTANTFIEAVREHNPQIVGLSSLITLTTKEIENVVEVLTEAGLRDSVKVMITGKE